MDLKVSIIVAIYNASCYLPKCIESIINQSYTNIECILVDDSSTDNSSEICNEYSNKDNRIIYIQNKQNIGCPQSRKVGFENSSGSYILFIDSDDWLEPTMVYDMLSLLAKKSYDIIFCDYFEDYKEKQIYQKQEFKEKTKFEIIKSMATYDPTLITSLWNKLIKRELLYHIVFPHENYAEDMYISTQLIYYSDSLGYINRPLYHYVFNDNSLCNSYGYNKRRILEHYDICVKIVDFLKNKYCNNLCLFEPELSIRINKAKIRIFINKDLRNQRDILKLYPESNNHIFNQNVPFHIIIKLRYYFYMLYKKILYLFRGINF